MEEEKEKFTDELKDELRDASVSSVNPLDYEIDEHIDDKYTSSVFEKYKSGKTKNSWFVWSGYLSVAFGVLCIVAMAVIGIIFAASSESLKQMQMNEGFDYDGARNNVIICCIIFPIMGIISIIVGLKIKSYGYYTKEELIDHVASIVGMSILQFFFGGLIFVVLTLVGYFLGIGVDYGAIYYNRIDSSSVQFKRLADAKRMYENGMISYNEYQNLRQYILRDTDFE